MLRNYQSPSPRGALVAAPRGRAEVSLYKNSNELSFENDTFIIKKTTRVTRNIAMIVACYRETFPPVDKL